MDGISVRKLFLSSRDRFSGTASDFVVQTDVGDMPQGCVAYVTSLSVSHSWWTVDAGRDRFYFVLRWTENGAETSEVTFVTLAHGSYTATSFVAELQTRLNACPFLAGGSTFTVAYNASQGNITVTLALGTSSSTFMPLPDAVLTDSTFRFQSIATWPAEPMTCNDLMSFDDRDVSPYLAAYLAGGALSASWTSEALDVRGVKTCYLHSNTLSGQKSKGPGQAQSCIRKLDVVSAFGGVLAAEPPQHYDFVSIGSSLSTIHIALRDHKNRAIDLHSGEISLAICFALEPF